MNQEDISIVRSERDASPSRYRTYDPTDAFARHHLPPEEQHLREEISKEDREEVEEPVEEAEPPESPRESIESAESVELQDIAGGRAPHGLKRTQTQTELINTSESHPTALDRIETHRSQHLTTVGSLRSRDSKRPLPNFGAGKPYPPGLPEREEYVVEFDGPHDPMHAQNWPMSKK